MILAKNLENLGTESAFSVLAEAKALEAKGNPMIHLGCFWKVVGVVSEKYLGGFWTIYVVWFLKGIWCLLKGIWSKLVKYLVGFEKYVGGVWKVFGVAFEK